MKENTVLEVKNLSVFLKENKETIPVVEQLDFAIKKGQTLGIIGESGSGKSITCSSILGLLDREKWTSTGTVKFMGEELPYGNEKQMNRIRGEKIAWITQNPMSAFNPLFTIEYHFWETALAHGSRDKKHTHKEAVRLLKKMHIHDPERVLKSYPFQLSGGMLQRVMIAIALLWHPQILVADEPTTALDLTVQYEIIQLLKEMKKELEMTILLVSHDLGVVSEIADDILVMYAGKMAEYGQKDECLNHPCHPYTKGLLSSRPAFSKKRLSVLEGQAASIQNRGKGCAFCDRCSASIPECREKDIKILKIKENHQVRCLEAVNTIGKQ